ncbi:hypothetical protein M406DRAFT_327414 [Cryphonectria parasitica EP155]|uniref:Uncharacterized protein n=1 Tax=Cryphonectria parasitica (strain ATCC 38755 / EP155) TaxID=660469 RepID=A0A9P4YAD0_CRYP1|nr:uncharacterized protein M406DRAFT_327414 [Cryphonectria parasitica EP155]KAF3769005.1 hypothetical protein M406DRAFT_327414 [Cryphonectria parasitica EP155]
MFGKTLVVLALGALAAASPAAVDTRGENEGQVEVYTGTTCQGGVVQTFNWQGSGTTSQCWPVTDIGSYISINNGCTAKLWANSDCTGKSYKVSNNDCNSLEFSAVSIKC